MSPPIEKTMINRNQLNTIAAAPVPSTVSPVRNSTSKARLTPLFLPSRNLTQQEAHSFFRTLQMLIFEKHTCKYIYMYITWHFPIYHNLSKLSSSQNWYTLCSPSCSCAGPVWHLLPHVHCTLHEPPAAVPLGNMGYSPSRTGHCSKNRYCRFKSGFTKHWNDFTHHCNNQLLPVSMITVIITLISRPFVKHGCHFFFSSITIVFN